MTPFSHDTGQEADDALRDTAARWVVRHDRKLSAAETVEFEAWRAADPRHAAAFERSTALWRMQRALGAAARRLPTAEPVPRARWNVVALGGLAVAAALTVIGYMGRRATIERTTPEATTRAVAVAAPISATRTLADGSVARLKDGAEMAEMFSATERRVKLLRGEAFFAVTKDPARPFYVEAGNVTVRAVGTAFSVNFAAHAVDVLVTEGTVEVAPPTSAVPETAPLVEAGHRAVVAHAAEPSAPAVVVTTVSREEIARSLAWSEPMLELAGATLGELVTRFAERSGRRIEVSDPALAAVRIGGRFPNEEVDGFLRALETVYDVKAERRADGSVTLRRAR